MACLVKCSGAIEHTPMSATTFIFVYGTLKEGFPNFHMNVGRRVPGMFRTRQPLPLYVVRLPFEDRAPWLLNSPGQGHQVVGQVFEVDSANLADMDVFEETHLPNGYVRVPMALEALHARDEMGGVEEMEGSDGLQGGESTVVHAHAYLKRPAELPDCLAAEGPFAEYTLALATGYWIENPSLPPLRPSPTAGH